MGTIAGFGPNRPQLETALQLGVIDEYHDAIGDVINNADIVVLAAPLAATGDLLKAMAAVWRGNSPQGKYHYHGRRQRQAWCDCRGA